MKSTWHILQRLAAENPDDVERRLTAKHSYILPPSTEGE